MLSLRRIELRAKQLLREHDVSNPPVPVEDIATALGALVRRAASPDVAGALYRKRGVVVIGVNKNDAAVRQRFTIAHEIGHLQLHKEPVYIDRHYVGGVPPKTEGTAVFRRDEVSSRAVDPREIEANRFAAALLMPEEFLRRDVKTLAIVAASDVQRLCKRYRVSPQAMIFRLINLRVPLETA